MDNMEETRRKWCDDLEAMMECPYCFDRLGEPTNVCEAGHNICKNCFLQVSNCGICKKPFTSTRNYLAENLGSILDNIKISLMNPSDIMNKVWNFEKNSVGTQTDFDPIFSNHDTSASDLQAALPDHIPWGDYPCLLEPDCKTKCNFFDIIKHFKAKHALEYKEHFDQTLPHSNVWEFTYDMNKFYNRAFLIPKVGLFLLHVGIDEVGNFRAYLVMYGSGRESRRFAYNFEVESGTEKTFFFGIVNSTRLVQMSMEKEGFFISCNESIFSEFVTNKIFKISVNIEKRDVTFSELRVETAKKKDSNQGWNNLATASPGSSRGARRRPYRSQKSSSRSSSMSLFENSPRQSNTRGNNAATVLGNHDTSSSSRHRENANNISASNSVGRESRSVDLKTENENPIGGNLFASLVSALTRELQNSAD